MDRRIIDNLQHAECFPHPVESFQVLETHISWVLLTGTYAYKIKKPINPGFLDFTTLEKRKFFCDEEIRLNKRLSPNIYQQVLPICGTADKPNLNNDGDVIEYAVQMVQFSQEGMLSHLADQNELPETMISEMAKTLAHFHMNIESADPNNDLGTDTNAHQLVSDNFDCISPLLNSEQDLVRLNSHRAWAEDTYTRIKPILIQRKQQGFIKECHGDIHLANVTFFNGNIEIFDCLEFSPYYRWIDVISDIAFLVMDLKHRNLNSYANLLLNKYLELTGDYQGLAVLNYYLAYRAMVRAKVAMLLREQTEPGSEKHQALWQTYNDYLSLAISFSEAKEPKLFIMHGVSGSGKSTIAKHIAQRTGAIQIRSDVERKRLHNLSPNQSSAAANLNIYTEQSTQKTFEKLASLAKDMVQHGFSVIVDGTFLKEHCRTTFAELAKQLLVKFNIIHCHAPEANLRKAIELRNETCQDPSEADIEVMLNQLKILEPISSNESNYTLQISTKNWNEIDKEIEKLVSSIP